MFNEATISECSIIEGYDAPDQSLLAAENEVISITSPKVDEQIVMKAAGYGKLYGQKVSKPENLKNTKTT